MQLRRSARLEVLWRCCQAEPDFADKAGDLDFFHRIRIAVMKRKHRSLMNALTNRRSVSSAADRTDIFDASGFTLPFAGGTMTRTLASLCTALALSAAPASIASTNGDGRWLVMGNAKGCAVATVGADAVRFTLVKPRKDDAEILSWLSSNDWMSGAPISWRYENGTRVADLRVHHRGEWTSIKGVWMGGTSVGLAVRPGEPSLITLMSNMVNGSSKTLSLRISDGSGGTITSVPLRGFEEALDKLGVCTAGAAASAR